MEQLESIGALFEESLAALAERIIDGVALREPRLLGVGVWLYALPVIGLALSNATGHLTGDFVFPRDLPDELIGPMPFTVGIALIGSAIAPKMVYVDGRARVRRLEHRVGQVLYELIRGYVDTPRVPGRVYGYAILIVDSLVPI